jgi:hypothetical protein
MFNRREPDAFTADPACQAYGGCCAVGVAKGRKLDGDFSL